MSQKTNTKMILTIGAMAVIILVAGFSFIGSGNGQEKTAKAEKPEARQAAVSETSQYPMAPDFTLTDIEGNEVTLSSYKGKVVFVNFWATWCPPCRREIPAFIELRDELGDEGFTVLGIAVDPREFNKVAPFADQMGMNYPVLLDKKGVSNLYGGISSIPTTFVVNREGKVVERIVGSRPKDDFKRIIQAHL